jgi:hypothetical protein
VVYETRAGVVEVVRLCSSNPVAPTAYPGRQDDNDPRPHEIDAPRDRPADSNRMRARIIDADGPSRDRTIHQTCEATPE